MERMNMTAMQSQEKAMNYNLQAAQINFAKANHMKIKQPIGSLHPVNRVFQKV